MVTTTEAPTTSATGRWIRPVLIALGILLLSAVWVGWRTYQAYRHLTAAAGQVSSLQQQVEKLDNIDLGKTATTVEVLRQEADSAASATADPLYRLASHLPWIGQNLLAISEITGTVDALARTTAPSLVEVAKTMQPKAIAPRNGAIDIAPLAAAAQTLQTADEQVTEAEHRMAAVEVDRLLGPVARAVRALQGKLTTLSATTGVAARIGRLAPPMLGAAGTRKYLVVFQNLAEPRATGGIFGSYVLLVLDHGKFAIMGQGSASRDLGKFNPPLAQSPVLSPALYGMRPSTFPMDVNLTPDFPTAATMFSKMYTARTKVVLDGVIAIDPVALSYLLSGVPPIDLGHGVRLTSSTLTSILLSKAYALYPEFTDADARDQFLADATTKAFAAVTGAASNDKAALRGLRKAAGEHRLQLWSSHPQEQQDLAATELATSLPSVDGSTPAIGVFRNDGTGGKLGYYAAGSASLAAGSCAPDGQRVLTLTINLRYPAPVTGLSPYVQGYARAGPYVLRTDVLIFAPLSGGLTAVTVSGHAVPVTRSSERGRGVGMITVDQRPGQVITVVGTLTATASRSVAAQFAPRLILTPGVSTWQTAVESYPAC